MDELNLNFEEMTEEQRKAFRDQFDPDEMGDGEVEGVDDE
mgnify:FL=1